VGPCAEISAIVDREGPLDHVRRPVRPGLTSQWPISPFGSGQMLHERLDLGIDCATTVTLRRDLWLVIQKVSVVAKGS